MTKKYNLSNMPKQNPSNPKFSSKQIIRVAKMPDGSSYHWKKVPISQVIKGNQQIHLKNMIADPKFQKQVAGTKFASMKVGAWWNRLLQFARDGASHAFHHITGAGKDTLGDFINKAVGSVGRIFDEKFKHEDAFGEGRSHAADMAKEGFDMYHQHKHHFESKSNNMQKQMIAQSKQLDDIQTQLKKHQSMISSIPKKSNLLSVSAPNPPGSLGAGWTPARVKRGHPGLKNVKGVENINFETVMFSIPAGNYAAGVIIKSFPLTIVNYGVQFQLMAQNYRKIFYKKIEVILHPLLSMTANGALLGFFDPDPTQTWVGTGFSNVTRANTITGCKSIAVMGNNTKDREVRISCPLNDTREFFINSEVGGDSRLVVPGTFYLMAESSFDTTTLAPNTDIFLVSVKIEGKFLDEITSTQAVSLNSIYYSSGGETIVSGTPYGGEHFLGTSNGSYAALPSNGAINYYSGSELCYWYKTAANAVNYTGAYVGLAPGTYEIEFELQTSLAVTNSYVGLNAVGGATIQQVTMAPVSSRSGSFTLPDGSFVGSTNNGMLVSACIYVPVNATGFGTALTRDLDNSPITNMISSNAPLQANIGGFYFLNNSSFTMTVTVASGMIRKINASYNTINQPAEEKSQDDDIPLSPRDETHYHDSSVQQLNQLHNDYARTGDQQLRNKLQQLMGNIR